MKNPSTVCDQGPHPKEIKRIIFVLPILIVACVLLYIVGITTIHPTTADKFELIVNTNTTRITIPCFYIGWLGHQNLGDEVLHEVFLLTNELYSNYFHINQTFSEQPEIDMNCFVLGGGSLINSLGYTEYLISPSMHGMKGMFGSGTDDHIASFNFSESVFPETFRSEVMNIIQNDNKDITKLIHFCRRLHPEIIDHHQRVLSTNPAIIRGYVSKLMLDCTYILTPNAEIVYPHHSLNHSLIGDSGMLSYKLVDTQFDNKTYKDWFNETIHTLNLKGQLKIAVNIGGGKKWDPRTWEKYRNSDDEAILTVFTRGLIKFCKSLKTVQSIDIILWSIWPKDDKVVETLRYRLTSHVKWLTNNVQVYNLAYINSSSNIIRLHQLCDISLTYKLHAMILSHSSLCPGVHLVYRIKGMDHASAVDLIDYAIGTDVASSDIVSEKLLNVYYRKNELKKHIERKRTEIDNAYKQWWRIFDDKMMPYIIKNEIMMQSSYNLTT